MKSSAGPESLVNKPCLSTQTVSTNCHLRFEDGTFVGISSSIKIFKETSRRVQLCLCGVAIRYH